MAQILTVIETHKSYGNQLMPPGGKNEAGESIQQTAIREMREETNVDLTQPDFTCVGSVDSGDKSKTRFYVYQTNLVDIETKPQANEIKSIHWYTRDQLLKRHVDVSQFGLNVPGGNKNNCQFELHYICKRALGWCSDLLNQPVSPPSSLPDSPVDREHETEHTQLPSAPAETQTENQPPRVPDQTETQPPPAPEKHTEPDAAVCSLAPLFAKLFVCCCACWWFFCRWEGR